MTLPFHPQPKPNRYERKAEARRERAEGRAQRDQLRRRIFHLDSGRCRCCGTRVFLRPSEAPHELAIGHVHEWVPRSLGGDPLAPTNCLLLCSACHPKVQGDVGGRELLIVALTSRLMRGPVEFIPFAPITLLAG
jgi:hypothetical protein